MWQNAHDAYLEERILSAEPVELVRLMYQAALGAVRDARRHLAARRIRERSRSITKATEVLIELASCLDYQRGGELSVGLGRLYDYMFRRLTEANIRQEDAPLAEVLGLLSTLSEGWEGIREPERDASTGNPWAQPAYPEPARLCASGSWSL